MVRERARAWSIHGLVLLAACAGTVETDLDLALPAADVDARARLVRLDIELWPPAEGVCRDLLAWRADTCPRGSAPGACPPAPTPRDRGANPVAGSALVRAVDGTWSELRLPALDQGPWDVRVTGVDAAQAALVYGCATLAPGVPREIPLWRPWCDVQACAGAILPACLPLASVRCPSAGESSAPLCTITATAMVLSWEEAGLSCPPESTWTEPCHPASVLCAPSEQRVLSDGICPRAPTCSDARQACSASVEPLQCDAACVHDAPCRVAGRTCTGVTRCVDRQSSVCTFPVEVCNGADDDCDGLDDRDDRDALATCNAGRAGYPSADRCTGARCQCGEGAPCSGRTQCVRGVCAPIGSIGGDAGSVDASAPDAAPASDGGAAPDARAVPDARPTPDAEPVDVGTPDAGLLRDGGLVRDSGLSRG